MAKIPLSKSIKYIVGIDGGGTKTKLVLYTLSGEVVDQLTTSTCHFQQIGYPGLIDLLSSNVAMLLQRNNINEKEAFISLGLAGYGNEQSVRTNLEHSVEVALGNYDYHLTNDVEIALYGALGLSDGIVLISGTGSIGLCKYQDELIRAGGWGYLVGDEGSGYHLGKLVLQTFAKEVDGRLPRGLIYDSIMEAYELSNPYDLISIISKQADRTSIASLAKYASNALAYGDHNALAIYEVISDELALLANSLSKPGITNVTYVGGVFNSGERFLDLLSTKLAKPLQLVKPLANAEYGAYLLAKKHYF